MTSSCMNEREAAMTSPSHIPSRLFLTQYLYLLQADLLHHWDGGVRKILLLWDACHPHHLPHLPSQGCLCLPAYSHHDKIPPWWETGNMSVMIKVGMCQNPTIHDKVQLGPVGSGKLFNMPPVLRHNISAQLGPSDRTQ